MRPYILASAGSPGCVAKVPARLPGGGEGGGAFCFLCPSCWSSSWVWGGRWGPFGELDGGRRGGPYPHAPKGQTGRAERDSRRWGLLALLTQIPQLLGLWPRR